MSSYLMVPFPWECPRLKRQASYRMHWPLQVQGMWGAACEAARFVGVGGCVRVTNTMTKDKISITPSPAMIAHMAFIAMPSAA